MKAMCSSRRYWKSPAHPQQAARDAAHRKDQSALGGRAPRQGYSRHRGGHGSPANIEPSEKDDDIWIYLPSTKKVRRLISSNKKASFVGTDFSYGDVIGHKPKEWNHTPVKEENIEGKDCWVIESIPKDAAVKANSGYSKRAGWIQKETFVTVKAMFYDEAGEWLKEAKFSNYKVADAARNRHQAFLLEMRNVQTEHSTEIRIDESKANTGVKEDFFTTRYMEQQ